MSAPRVLAIETASQLCSVAILEGSEVAVVLSLSLPRAHAERLPILIRDALGYAGMGPEEMTTVAVSAGPGSYTGLRIGVSAAKGFAYAVQANLVAVDSLYARARAAAALLPAGGILGCVLPSRRDEVYAGVYSVQNEGSLEPVSSGMAVAVSDFPGLLPAHSAPVLLVGEGAARLSALQSVSPDSLRIIPGPVPGFDASWIARIALERIRAGEFEDLMLFEPSYLKPYNAIIPTPAFGDGWKSKV